jgi:rod shape-determining protein MreD
MTRTRVAAALAGMLTALLLQATLIGPVTAPVAVSLPAVLVAAIALVDGPGTGMSFGFVTGLLADLGSSHPAGVLALCWLGVGLLCGTVADRHSVRRDAVTAGLVCGPASAAATVLLAVVGGAGSVLDAITYAVPAAAGDAVLALAVVAIVRRMLRSEPLRAPHPGYPELVVGVRRG